MALPAETRPLGHEYRATPAKGRPEPRNAQRLRAHSPVGIGDYVLSHGPWSMHFAKLGTNDHPPEWLESSDGDGVTYRGEILRTARVIDRLKVPKVDLTPSRL